MGNGWRDGAHDYVDYLVRKLCYERVSGVIRRMNGLSENEVYRVPVQSALTARASSDGATRNDGGLIAELRREGAAVCGLSDLDLTLSQFEPVRRLPGARPAPKHDWDVANHGHEISGAEILRKVPEVYRLGAKPELLRLAEEYLQDQPILYDVTFRRDFCSSRQLGVRRWHRDREARSLFKLIVYLTDVGDEDGAFEFVPKPHTPWRLWFRLFPMEWRYTDRAMQFVVRAENWRRVTGSAGTAILTDTAAVYHHCAKARDSREAVTYTYVPIRP
jgi:hypothetical protein